MTRSLNPRDLHHLADAYALDALDTDERVAFEAHYPTCEICSADVRHGREVAAVLAETVAVHPPDELKASVMAEIGRTRQISPRVPDRVVDIASWPHRTRRAAWLGAAAAALVAVVGVATLVLRDGPSDLSAVVAAPDAIVTELDGARGSLRIVWSGERDQVAVFGNGLADPGPGLAYALWFLGADGSATAAGLFEPGREGSVRTVLEIADLDTTGWGVTIEPETGSPQPTTDVIFQGEI